MSTDREPDSWLSGHQNWDASDLYGSSASHEVVQTGELRVRIPDYDAMRTRGEARKKRGIWSRLRRVS